MQTFAVIYTYTDDERRRTDVRPIHREYLVGLSELLVAGAWGVVDPPGGLLVFRAADRQHVEKIIHNDPFFLAGDIISKFDIREWSPPVGPMAARFQGPI